MFFVFAYENINLFFFKLCLKSHRIMIWYNVSYNFARLIEILGSFPKTKLPLVLLCWENKINT